jgi:UDP:flavonoid glycosyltransferase YjiC (YdhE family)
MSRIVLTTVGSFGDLHPKIALALELRRRGHDIVFATHQEYQAKLERLGFAFHRMRPDASALADPKEMARMMNLYRGQEYVIRRWLMPALDGTYEDLLQCAARADLIISGEGVFAARLVAEKLGIPWISTVLQPLSFLSAHEPFILPGLPLPAWLRNSGDAARKMQIALVRAATSRWADPVKRLRARIGLPPLNGNLFVDDKYSPHLVLALFSAAFAKPQADWPADTVATGFPFYDGSDTDGIAPALGDFLGAGPPPVVFTLGSSAVMTPGRFFDESVATARNIGRRAILLIGKNPPPRGLGSDCLALEYAPYSTLFPRACAVVHQGGIGTTGQALRAGRPTLIMPYSLDQPDNAARAARLGTSLTVPRRHYQARRITRLLTRLLEQPDFTQRATAVGTAIQAEEGVVTACNAIEHRLSTA